MSTVNYSLKNKGVRLIGSKDAWVVNKNGTKKLNPKYTFVGKIETSMPNMVLTAGDKQNRVIREVLMILIVQQKSK